MHKLTKKPRRPLLQAACSLSTVACLLLAAWATGHAPWQRLANPGAGAKQVHVHVSSGGSSELWKPNQPPQPSCSDTCPKAKDGVCDEGRTVVPDAPAVLVLCDLGTDCTDCGPWAGHLPRWSGPGAGPVAFALSHNASVLVKQTTTQPSFLMPITVKERDPDVSAMLDNYGAMEGGVTRVAYEILGGGQCLDQANGQTPDAQHTHAHDHSRHRGGLVLDVGANFGYFTLYAAAMGCRVMAWEPVEVFSAFLHYGIALNNLTHLVAVRQRAVSDNATSVSIGIPKDGTYWGLASVDNLNVMPHEVKETVNAAAERLDAVVSEPVLLLKVDVEGYEPQVVASAGKLLESTQHMLLEYSPGIPERSSNFTALARLPAALLELLDAGFVAGHMPMRIATPWPPKSMTEHYASPVPVSEEVTAQSLQLDIRAAQMRLKEEGEQKSCPIPEELRRFPVWAGCREWAYAAHPKGFRSSFGFNTNLWLSRSSQRNAEPAASSSPSGMLYVMGQASLFAPDQAMKVWTSARNPGQSTGFMDCQGMGSSHKLIFHCSCTKPAECGEEQQVIEELLQQGKMPMQTW